MVFKVIVRIMINWEAPQFFSEFFLESLMCSFFSTLNPLSLKAAVVTALGRLLESCKMMSLRPCIACGLF